MRLFDEMPGGNAPIDEFPDPFASTTCARIDTRRSILALDLGTKLGWATVDRNGAVRAGSVSCKARANEPVGQRWIHFRSHLNELAVHVGEFDAVYFEDVKAHGRRDQPNVIAAHVYGAFLGHLEHWCALRNLTMHGLGVGEVKKAWSGKGNAAKADMIAAAQARGFSVVDDNHADALAILHLAITRESAR